MALLPFLNEADLMSKFHIDEPWDSANNAQYCEPGPTYSRAHLWRWLRNLRTMFFFVMMGRELSGKPDSHKFLGPNQAVDRRRPMGIGLIPVPMEEESTAG